MNPTQEASAKCNLSITVNGEAKRLLVYPMERLLDVLRNELGLTGTKEGCGEGECGSCSVLIDGTLVNSCLIPVAQANGASIVTIEGSSAHALLHNVRADPADYKLVSPGSLQAVLSLLSKEPAQWLPIAGGTDLMVLYAAGKLPNRKLVNLWNISELREMEVFPDRIRIGAACTYTALREHDILRHEFPLLAAAASWTGGIANQNRGTLGGNIANASPAADSLPALLVYDAELTLVSVRGERRVPYRNFHTGYKQTALAPDELIRDISMPRCFSGYICHARKVGTRNAQAISKVCLAALGRLVDGVVQDVRIALGSVAPIPLRLGETERVLLGKKIEAGLIEAARKSVAREIQPIDDIRSTARYRTAVAGNLVAEFLGKLAAEGTNA